MPAKPPGPGAAGDWWSRKWMGIPVVVLMAAGLIAAYLYAQHRNAASSSTPTTATTSATDAAAEPSTSAPAFIIENNLPAGGYGAPSAPVSTPATPPTTVTPPSTQPAPPTTIQGANPPAKVGAPLPVGAVTSKPVTTSKPPVSSTPPAKKTPIAYKVVSGDSLSAIASRYHTTWQALWTFNTTPGNRSASDIATLKQRGPNLLYAGETIYIPQ